VADPQRLLRPRSFGPESEAMTGWDPYQILWQGHDPHLTGWQVLRANLRLMNWMYRMTRDRSIGQASRIGRACWVLRTRARRHRILANLTIQLGWLWTYPPP